MPYSNQTQQKLCYDVAPIIAVGETTSNAVQLCGTTLLAFKTDANITGSIFTFLVSDSLTGTFIPLKDMNTGFSLQSQAGASGQYATQPADFASVEFIKFVMNTAQLTTPTTITLITRSIS